MAKRKQPRDAIPDDPDLCVTSAQRHAFQQRLQKACEECSPADWPWFDPFDERWWCIPGRLSPEEEDRKNQQYAARERKYIERQQQR